MCGDNDVFTQYDNQIVMMEVVFEEVYIDNVFLCQVIVYIIMKIEYYILQ